MHTRRSDNTERPLLKHSLFKRKEQVQLSQRMRATIGFAGNLLKLVLLGDSS